MRAVPMPAAVLALIGALLLTPVIARADEHPSPDQRTRIEAALTKLGFERPGEIERSDDGRAGKVDDARTRDGTQYDLRLSTDDLSEIWRHRDDND